MKVQGRRKRRRPKRRWLDKVKDDIKEKGLSADDVLDPYVIIHRPHIKVGIRCKSKWMRCNKTFHWCKPNYNVHW